MGQDRVAIDDGVEIPDHISKAFLNVDDDYDSVGLVKSFPGELRLDARSAGEKQGWNP